MIRNEKCEVWDKQNFEPKYRMVYDMRTYYLGPRMKKVGKPRHG